MKRDSIKNCLFLCFTAQVLKVEGNLSERIDENGDITKYEYDAMWNICKIIKPDGSEIKYNYNKSNLLQMTEDEEGYREYMLYDSNGNITDYADRNEKVSTREYDALDRIVKSTAPNGAETEFEYRYDGKLKKVTDALKGTEEFEYNRAGELTEVKLDRL